jgi:hypothetical protein
MPCASTNGTPTVTVGVSRTPGRYIRCPNRSPAPPRSRVCTSADTIAPADTPTNRNTPPELRTDEIVGTHKSSTAFRGMTAGAPRTSCHPILR